MAYDITPVLGVYLEIAEVPLATPAWQCLNPMELRQGLATRGRDRLIPGAAGVLAGKRRPTATERLLELVVAGTQDWEGEPWPDPIEGLDANLMHLREFVTDPLANGRDGGPLEAVLHLPDGSTSSGLVHVESFTWGYWGPDAHAAMTVTVLGPFEDGDGS